MLTKIILIGPRHMGLTRGLHKDKKTRIMGLPMLKPITYKSEAL